MADRGEKGFSQEDIMKILGVCYDKCINGIPKVS